MASTLITWSCGHFCVRHSTGSGSPSALIEAATEDFWFLAKTANDDLANISTTRHITSSGYCPKCQEPVGAGMWKLRAHEGIEQLLYLYDSCKMMYLEAAAKYCMLDFSQKARYANDARCSAAHEQFWISTTPRHLDPLFAPMENIVALCDEANTILLDSKTRADVICAFKHINKARALVGRLMDPLDGILTGVELISAAKNKRSETNTGGEDELLSREAMVSAPKTLNFFARMEDWEEDAVDAVREALA